MAGASRPLLEIAANSLASARIAEDAGADRIELCASLAEGGLTPSYATIALARERLRIPIHVLIRPRSGDFLYNDSELETMRGDIEICVRLGCDGIVVGALDAHGHVDDAAMSMFAGAAAPLRVTFHRAFDLTPDPHAALEALVALGCERVLTSGQAARAIDGAQTLRDLVRRAAGRIAVMPGAGIDAGNIAELRAVTGAGEFHASAKRMLTSAMRHRPPRLADMQGGEARSDGDEIRRMIAALETAVAS